MSLKVIACINADGMLAGFRPPRDDLNRFAALTIGGVVIMGRKTWEALPDRARPLPHRLNVIVTRAMDYEHPSHPDVACYVSPNGLDNLLKSYEHPSAPVAWVIGGGEVYGQAIGRAGYVYLSRTEDRGGSVPFPLAPMNGFLCIADQQHPTHRFQVWRRRA